jgi:hypothetical protein
MSVSEVRTEVERFLKQSQYEVLAIKGAWGVGKTHGWHQFVSDYKDQIKPDTYSYVSLFGISSLADLRMAILANSRPTGGIGKNLSLSSINQNWWTLGLAKLNLMRRSFTNLDGGSTLKNVFVTLDALAPSLVTDRLICFDDFERIDDTKLSHDELLGFISTLKETANCKIAIILNDAEVAKETATFQKYREKVIEKEIKFDPTVDEAIAWGLDDDVPYARQIKDCARLLEIKNVRILRKMAKVVVSLAPAIRDKRKETIVAAIHSAVLLTWCYYDKTGQAPNLDFVKSINLLSTVKGRTKDGQAVKATPEEDRWTATLSIYKFLYYDELDAAIVKVIEQGYLTGSGIDAEVAHRDADYQKGDLQQKFADAWKLFHDSMADNEEELVAAMTSSLETSAHNMNPSDLNAVVILLRELDRGPRADELIQFYIEARSHEPDVFDLDSAPFGTQISDGKIRGAFAAKLRAIPRNVTLRQVIEKMAISSGWNAEEQSVLSAATADDLYRLFGGEVSVPLHKMIATCLRFNQAPLAHIAERTIEALRRLGGECRLNAIRMRRYGISDENDGLAS